MNKEFLPDNDISSCSEYGSSDSDSATDSDSHFGIEEYTHVVKMHRTMSQRIQAQQIIFYEQSQSDLPELSSKYSLKTPRSIRMDTESSLSEARNSIGKLSLRRFNYSTPTPSFTCPQDISSHDSLSTSTCTPIGRGGEEDATDRNDRFDQELSTEEHQGLLSSISLKQPSVAHCGGEKRIVETTSVKKIISNSQKRYINKYLLQERLGKGSFGTVRKCKDITTGVTYAMKIMVKNHLEHQLKYTRTENNTIERSSALDRVEQEIAIMKKIQHKNIVNLVEVINSEKVLYLILEYMTHGSLAEGTVRIRRLGSEFKGDDCELLRLYMRDIVSGLAYLHSQRICHSDIKPENILAGDDGVLKLGDFGLSLFLGKGQSSRVFNEKDGTPAFQAPECFMDAEDHRFSLYPTDIWALGVTLYQIKYGILPFFSEDAEVLMEKIQNDPVHIPSSENDQDFIKLVHALLNKDPIKRITVQQLCVHPWITKRGHLEDIQFHYTRANVTKSEQRKAMSKLIKIPTKDPKENLIPSNNRCQSSWMLDNRQETWQPSSKRLTEISPRLNTISEQSEKIEGDVQPCIRTFHTAVSTLNDASVVANKNSLEYLVNQDTSFSNGPSVSKPCLKRFASVDVNNRSSFINTTFPDKISRAYSAPMEVTSRAEECEARVIGINENQSKYPVKMHEQSTSSYSKLVISSQNDIKNLFISPSNVNIEGNSEDGDVIPG